MEFIILVLVFSSGFLIGKYRSSYEDNIGERAVRKLLTTNLPYDDYQLLNNVTIPIDNGSTQIDHILVSTKGIFVIETKHYSGWIFGNANSKKWTQVIYKSKNQFQNPLHQNYSHVKALTSLLDFLDPHVFKSLVVFTGTAEFKSKKPAGVYNLQEIISVITSHKEEVISKNRMQFCVGRIECTRYEISQETDIEHISLSITFQM